MTLLFLLLALLLAPNADAATRTCHSGHTVSKHAGVRIFWVSGSYEDTWYGCGPHSRRPVELYSAPGGLADFRVVRSAGRMVFIAEFSGEGGGEDTTIGWFDGRVGRSAELAGSVSNEVLGVVAAADGSVGVVAGLERDVDVRIGYLAYRRGVLHGELGLSMAGGRYVPGSLAFADGGRTLRWRLADGSTRSAPVAGEAVTCTSGTTLIDSEGERVFEVLPPRKTRRGFQADVLAVCPPGATTPRELAVSDLYDQAHWDVSSVKHAGTRLAFVAGGRGIGVLDGADVRFTPIQNVQEVAIALTGPPAFAAGGFVARLDPGGARRLAVLGGDLIDGSLTITDDPRVTWQTKERGAQSVPLAGETAATCTAGTTLLFKDGLRVSELLLDTARLLACPPGATDPVLLVSASRDTDWTVTELARKNGRTALFARTLLGDDRMISLGTDTARAGIPNASLAYATIRDIALASDGRIAVALHSGHRWTVTVFGLGSGSALKPERVLTHPRKAVRVGTLAFSGARIVWRDPSGAAHGVPTA